MRSDSFHTFEHAIADADDLLNQFDAINNHPPPPEAEVLKRACLVMALVALETYVEDRVVEASKSICTDSDATRLSQFFQTSLENDLKTFHTPSTDRIKVLFRKYLDLDVTEGWNWNHYDPVRARRELNSLAKKRGDIAHRSSRPIPGKTAPHAVTIDDLRKHVRFIKDLVNATDEYLGERL